jgi:hypothetical protein
VGAPIRALIALALFLPFALTIFRRMPRAQAATVVVLAGSAFLPEKAGFRLPVIQVLEKEYITYLVLLIAAFVHQRRSLMSARLGFGLESIVVLMWIENVFTALANTDAMWDEGKLEPGLGIYAVIVKNLADALSIGLPFFLGRALFRSKDDLRVLMTGLSVAGLIYVPLITIEVLMSLPFHVWQLSHVVFGVDTQPQWRWGIIQPVVFMDNGLSLATWMGGCLIATAGLLKGGLPIPRMKPSRARPLLFYGLVMSRNVAGIVYGSTLTLLTAILRPRLFATVAFSVALLAVVYPSLRMADLFPNKAIVSFAKGYDAERARSLEGRFEEEDLVLGGLKDRFWIGWGTYGRTPGAETVGTGEPGIDGWWVLRLGMAGLTGVELSYSIMLIPAFLAWRRTRRLRSNAVISLVGALIAIVGMRMIDLLLNGWWNHLPVFLAGVLAGVSPSLGKTRPVARVQPAQQTATRIPA